MANKFAVHLNPIWRDRANFIIHAKCIDDEDDPANPKFEQLWSKRIADNTFEICCIPFFIYDLALGDEVETSAEGQMQYVVQRVIKPSGHYTFRVWFGNSSDNNARNEVPQEIARLGCLLEWSSINLLAIDATSDRQAEAVAALLYQKEKLGQLLYETGRSK